MRILVASPIDKDALEELKGRHDVVAAFGAPEDELRRLAVDREAIIFRSGVSISSEVLAAATGLRLLVRAGSGLDNLDLEQVRRRGIDLRRVPGPGAQAVAELTFGLMLSLARGIALGDRLLRQGHWAKSELVGYNLTGKTLGIVGLGSIGTRVAALGAAWGMRPIGVVESPSPERAAEFATHGIELTDARRRPGRGRLPDDPRPARRADPGHDRGTPSSPGSSPVSSSSMPPGAGSSTRSPCSRSSSPAGGSAGPGSTSTSTRARARCRRWRACRTSSSPPTSAPRPSTHSAKSVGRSSRSSTGRARPGRIRSWITPPPIEHDGRQPGRPEAGGAAGGAA